MRILFTILLLLATLPALGDKDIRDASGNLVRTERDFGNQTEVRGPDGNLDRTRTRYGNEVEIRDRSGNLIGTEDHFDD